MKIFSKHERQALLAEFRTSGKAGTEFCREKGIKVATFYNWRKSEKQTRKSEFVKINNHLDGVLSAKIILEKNGWRIILPSDQKSIRTIFNALGLLHAD